MLTWRDTLADVLVDASRPAKTMPKSTMADPTDAILQATITGITSGDVWAEEIRRNIASRCDHFKDGC